VAASGLRFDDVTHRLSRIPLAGYAAATAVLFAIAIGLIFFYAPNDPNQGLSQRIFYFHVPIAFTAYAAFGWGAWKALLHLWKRREGADLESYVAIHQGVVFGSLVLITGSIWAKISWGVWWDWGDDELVLFLVLYLFYCAYFMLRYSVEPGPARANMSAVYALFGVVLVPISFFAIRISRSVIHPEVFTVQHGYQMTNSQFLTFCVSLLAMLSLFATLYQTELAGKRLDAQLKELRELIA
jgi:heme exporter protein C